ncbi:MAG: YitT family protein [Treponema sp.]|nr:YitT family protein [Treponema sp.]
MNRNFDIHTILEKRRIQEGLLYEIRRILLVCCGAIVMGFNLSTFVPAAGMIPGGFTGFGRLAQMLFAKYAGKNIPFSPIYYTLNLIAVVICFKYIGKKFTLYSLLMIFLSGLLADLIPNYEVTHDVLLCSVFGGILNALAISLCLMAGATSGGTDFIAIYVSEKYNKTAWNYIFAGNVVMLATSGFLLSWDSALYSIIFQFTSTQILNHLYTRFQRMTLFIITNKAQILYNLIRDNTHHTATLFSGTGCYSGEKRDLVYTVVGNQDLRKLLPLVKQADPQAFINFIPSKEILGRFYKKPTD